MSTVVLCLHEFVNQFPDVLLKVFGELPKWAFRESIRNSNKEDKQKPFDQKRWKKQSAGYAATAEAAFKHFNQSNNNKNKIVQYGLLTDTSLKVESKLSSKRALKRSLLNERAE